MRAASLALTLILAAPLASCKNEPSPPAVQASGVAVSSGILVLPAVRGNPAAAYFTVTNFGPGPVTPVGVEIDHASMAMFHETRTMDGHSTMDDMALAPIPAGGHLQLVPGGKHVMVEGLPLGLKPGYALNMTVTFDNGAKASAKLKIQAAGGGS